MDILMQLLPELVCGVIGAVGAVFSYTHKISHRLTRLETQMDALDKKVDKHNSVIERTYILEGKVSALENQ